MMNDEHGCTLCKAPGQERLEYFNCRLGRKTYVRCQYDYRHTDGELFSCIGNSLEDCRKARDKWLENKN